MIRHILAALAFPLLACGGEAFTTAADVQKGSELPTSDDASGPAIDAGSTAPLGQHAGPGAEAGLPDALADAAPDLSDATKLPDGDTCLDRPDGGPCLFVLTATAKACAPGCLGADGNCHAGIGDDQVCGTAVSRGDGRCVDCAAGGAWCNQDQECTLDPRPDASACSDDAGACASCSLGAPCCTTQGGCGCSNGPLCLAN